MLETKRKAGDEIFSRFYLLALLPICEVLVQIFILIPSRMSAPEWTTTYIRNLSYVHDFKRAYG